MNMKKILMFFVAIIVLQTVGFAQTDTLVTTNDILIFNYLALDKTKADWDKLTQNEKISEIKNYRKNIVLLKKFDYTEEEFTKEEWDKMPYSK